MREGLTSKTGQAVLAQMYFKYIYYTIIFATCSYVVKGVCETKECGAGLLVYSGARADKGRVGTVPSSARADTRNPGCVDKTHGF